MRIFRRFLTLLRRDRVDAEIRREMAFHLAMEAAERERRGLSAVDAQRIARVDFGGAEQMREEVRDARGLTWWDHLVQDVKFGVRLLVRQPGFTAVAVIMLALGIGANTAVFSIVNTMMLKPRVGHADGELVGVFSKNIDQPDVFRAFSHPDYVALRARTDLFASLTAHDITLAGLAEGEATRRVVVDIATGNFFDTFGAPVAIGRAFTPEEDRPGADVPVTVLSYAAWQRLGGRPDILSQTVRVNARDYRVVGVAAKGFGGSLVFVTPDLWLPLGVYDTISKILAEDQSTKLADPHRHSLLLIGRLRPGVAAASVGSAVDGLGRALAEASPAENAHYTVMLAPLARMGVSTRPTDDQQIVGMNVALLSMAAVVLLVASFNLGNMLLARSGARRKEFAIRLAIGGSRGRLVRQLLTEGLVLALLGGAAGLVLAGWATKLLVATLTPLSPVSFSYDATPDWRILAAMIAYCALSTIVFGLLPARRLAGTNPGPELKGHSGELVSGKRRRLALPNALVMGQLALSLVLISVAALFMRGATEAAKADPGFTFDRGVLIQVDPGMASYEPARSRAFYGDVMDALRARSDVAAASLATLMPFSDMLDGRNVQRAGAPIPHTDADHDDAAGLVDATYTGVGSGYFDALGLSLEAGRDFTVAEERTTGNPRIAIIDAPLSRHLFGPDSPLGRPIQFSSRDEKAPPVVMTIVGVVPGVRDDLFDQGPKPHLYVPFGSAFQSNTYLHVRTRATSGGAESSLLPGFRALVHRIDPNVPILALQTRAMFRDRGLLLAVVRVGAAIFLVFGAVALALAAVGVYGVKAYVVSRRTREIGIRVALGATSRRVVWLVVREGLLTSTAGLGIGLVLSAVVGVAMRSMTYQGRGADAVVLGFALAVLTASTLIASWLPARRATRITPLRALRD